MRRLSFITITLLLLSLLPSSDAATFYYVPHQKDDYLALSLAIASSIADGTRVQVMLYGGAGEGDPDLGKIFGKSQPCPLQNLDETFWENTVAYENHKNDLDANGYHTHTLDAATIGNLRDAEFNASMHALGLHPCDLGIINSDTNCYVIFHVDPIATLDRNKRGYWGDTLTRVVYNLIVNNEINNPLSTHACVGSPRDCDATWSTSPAHLACYYAAQQLLVDAPTGVSGSWNFRYYMSSLPFASNLVGSNATDVNSALTSAAASQKLNSFLGTTDLPTIMNYPQYLPQKKASGMTYKNWDPANNLYALGLHSAPFLFPSAQDSPNVYYDTNAGLANAKVKTCPADALFGIPPPIIRGVPVTFLITGMPGLPPPNYINEYIFIGISLSIVVLCFGIFAFRRFGGDCCRKSNSYELFN